MLTRPAPESVTDNPLIDSPYNATYLYGLGSYHINNYWMLLDTDHFTMLDGSNWSFLGTF